MHRHFNQQTFKIAQEKTWTCLRKRNLNRKSDSLLITTQNNAIRTNYVKSKINKTQQNGKCRIWGEKTHNKRMQQVRRKGELERHGWVGKVINYELCKRL